MSLFRNAVKAVLSPQLVPTALKILISLGDAAAIEWVAAIMDASLSELRIGGEGGVVFDAVNEKVRDMIETSEAFNEVATHLDFVLNNKIEDGGAAGARKPTRLPLYSIERLIL